MVILRFFILLIIYSFHLFIPFNLKLYNNLELNIPDNSLLIIYLVGIIFYIWILIKLQKINYDNLFLIMLHWLSNLMGYIYFNIFGSLNLTFFSFLISFVSIIFFIKQLKKINKSYPRYLIILLGFYVYLLFLLFKFI